MRMLWRSILFLAPAIATGYPTLITSMIYHSILFIWVLIRLNDYIVATFPVALR